MISILKLIAAMIIIGLGVKWSLGYDEKTRDRKINITKATTSAAILIAYLIIIVPAIGVVDSGYRGVVIRLGAVTGRILPEGIYVVTPLLERVEEMSVQVQAETSDASAASKDLQQVETKVTLNYALDPSRVAEIYQQLRQDYVVRVVNPAIQESVKSSTAQFEAEKLITERQLVKENIEQVLVKRLAEFGIKVNAVNITDFDFSKSFNEAIELKVKASQEALKAQRDLERIKTEAQQKIESAKAEAESLRIQREQVTPQLIELRKIEAQIKAVDKWNGQLPQIVTGGAGSPVPVLDLFSKTNGVNKN